MTLLEREREALSAPPTHTELVLRLHGLAKEALASGISAEQVMSDLNRLREEVRRDDPEREDIILDVMDAVEGWVGPHMSLRAESGDNAQGRRHSVKRDTKTGRIVDVKRDGKPFKGIRKEK